MGSDALRQLSPSGDREASRAQHKSGSKRAGSTSRRRTSSRERSSSDRARRRDRRSRTSQDSSPSRRQSTAAYRSRPDRAGSKDSCSSEGRPRSQRSPRPWTSRSRSHWRRDSSPSTSPTRRFRSSPAPSRRPFGAGMTKRLAGRPSTSPPRRSHSHRQSRHPSRDSSPPTSRFRGRHHLSSSSSRSPSPKRPRTERGTHSHRDSRSLSQERGTHPYDSDIRLLRLRADSEEDRHIPSSHPRGSPEPAQSIGEDDSLSAAKVQKLFADLAAPPALSHYADPIPDSTANTQLVPYVRQSTTSSSSVKNSEPLETHGLFRNYQSFHRLSGDNEKEARTAAYYDLTSLMISQTDEAPLINVSFARPKMEDPFPHSAVSSNEMKKKSEKMILQWPPQSSHSKVIDRTLGFYQHGPPPKAGTNEKWPPPTVKNPWDKSFVPKEFPTTHKIPSTMPKRWDLHSSSPLMLRPPLSTAVQEVPDAAISKSSSWLEAFAARAAHTATMSATSIVSVYNFQQKVLEFLRDSAAKNNIQNDISVIDDLFQRANSMALEAHIMAHDSGVTATELFTHLHMLRRRSVLEDPSVSLPQRDKDRLLVMEVGGQDLFGPNARQVHEWKRDTEEENVKLIARVFDERNQRDKSKKKPASSESRTPRSVEHRSPLAGLSRPKPKDSYSQKPGQSFRRQPKQSPYKARSGNQSRTQTYNRDRPNASSAPTRNDSREQGQRRQDKDSKGPSSNRPFNRKGRAEAAAKAENRTSQLPVGGKLVHFTETWTQHFPQHYEIVRKVSNGILIAFDDAPPPLLRHPLEIPSNNKTADLLHAVQKLRLSQAIEEVVDTTSPGYYSRLFLVPKPDGSFRPIIDLKKLNHFIIVPSFKMETLFSIIAALQPNEWITKIDLKDAYHHILVHVNIRKYFRFVVAGTVYQFRVLPFGLSTAPREFTKTLAPVVHLLRSRGIQVHAYLDDWIIRASSKELSLLHTQQVLQLLQSLGWTINWDKSMWQPTRILDFLGLHFNLEQALISPPDSFLPTLTEVLSRLSPSTVMSARKVSSIISRLSHFAPFITNGRLHLRFLQLWFKDQWTQHRQSWDTPVKLDSEFLSYLRWFLHPSVMTGVLLRLPDPSLFFFTDASLKGWGASWQTQQLSGVWSQQESRCHINWLELEAIRLALLHWGLQWSHQTVQVYCDNSTAVAYIRKQGGTHSKALFHKTLELYQLLDQYRIILIPTHLPGARNVTADALSRLSQPSPTEWRLQQVTLNRLFYVFGTPLIDMFATAENKVTPIFVSPYPDDRAWAVDALSLSWDDLGLIYAFPPAPIVPKTIQKIQKSRGTTVILIASQHPSLLWHPLLLQLSTRPRIPLTDAQLFQYVPNLRRPQFHRDPKLLDLAAWLLSGIS